MALKNFFLTMGNQPYRVAITNFQTRVDGLLQAANEKNLEASSEAYTRVIRGCIECHKQFRLPQFRPEEK
jgi:cytochrome c556